LLSRNSTNATVLIPNTVALYANLVDKSHFQQLDEVKDALVLTELDDLFHSAVPGMADLYFGDYSSFENSEAVGVPILAYIKRLALQGGVAGIFDVGVQFGVEYFFGPADDFDGAWTNFEWEWRQTLWAVAEGALPTKYGPYLGAAQGAIESSIQLLNADQDVPLSQIFGEVVMGAVRGYFYARLGDLAGKLIHHVPKYSFPVTHEKLVNVMGDRFGPLMRTSAELRKVAIETIWTQEANQTLGPLVRGFYIEEILSYGKYASFRYTNNLTEEGLPVDFFIENILAVQTKSIAKIDPGSISGLRSSIHKAMFQLDKTLREGIVFDGVHYTFPDVRVDFCIPENMVQHIPYARGQIENYIRINLSRFPHLAQLGSLKYEIGTFTN
jgi:hypothetical protein